MKSRLSLFTLFSLIFILFGITLLMTKHPQDIRQRAAGTQCISTGVSKNANGSYSFSPLHVDSQGNVADQNNCTVYLLGYNQWWLDSDATGGPNQQTMIAEQQLLHTNIVRITINANWWKTNVLVPKYNIQFQNLLKQVVQQEEQAGNYVELNIDAEFTEPPCAQNGQSTCPHQNQGRLDYAADPVCKTNPTTCPEVAELEEYQPTALSALTDLAKLYANDPAIIFDVWNEPGSYIFVIPGTQQNRAAWMDTRINTVRQYAPDALVVVYTAGTIENLSHTQPNLAYDFHAYPNFNGTSPITGTSCSSGGTNFTNLQTSITALKDAGKATIIGEWGHCYLNPPSDPNYNQQILTLAQSNNTGLTYFGDTDLFKQGQLNANGLLVQQDYVSILSQTTPTPTSGVTSTPTPTTITPTITQSQNETQLNITVCPHGLGNCGDNMSPNGGGNTNPLHTTRSITLTIFDSNNNQVGQPLAGTIMYVPSAQNFQGTIAAPNLLSGNYLITVKMDGFLAKQYGGIIAVTQGQRVTLPQLSLVSGNINNDNQLDISDYNILISCFGQKLSTSSCPQQYRPSSTSPGADISDDDRQVDGVDYNLFLRELSVQQGDIGPSITPSPTGISQSPTPTPSLPVSPTPNGNISGLHVQGNQLENDQGQVVHLHGVDQGGPERACIQTTTIFNEPNNISLPAMKAWGINLVRVPINEDCWLGINGANPAIAGQVYRRTITDYITQLNQNGIYAIFDLHRNAAGSQLSVDDAGLPDQDHAPAFWTSAANTFKGNNAVIFDVYNEPHPGATWTCLRDGGTCLGFQSAGMQELVNTIRVTGATNVLMIGALQYDADFSQWLAFKPTDPLNNIVASWHTYNVSGNPTTWQATIGTIAQHVPVITGEFNDHTNSGQFMTDFPTWMDQNGINYSAWQWYDPVAWSNLTTDGSGIPNGNNGISYKNYLSKFAH